MPQVTVSPKYQVVIPKVIRQQHNIKTGQKMIIMATGPIIQLVPLKPIKKLRGMLPNINTDVKRDRQDRV